MITTWTLTPLLTIITRGEQDKSSSDDLEAQIFLDLVKYTAVRPNFTSNF